VIYLSFLFRVFDIVEMLGGSVFIIAICVNPQHSICNSVEIIFHTWRSDEEEQDQ